MKRRSNKSHPTTRGGKKSAARPLSEGWDPKKWLIRCAWCGGLLPTSDKVLAIRVSLHAAAFKEIDPGTIHPLYLNSIGRVVPMVILKQDDFAKMEGKDAQFKLCSKDCAEALLAVLKGELR